MDHSIYIRAGTINRLIDNRIDTLIIDVKVGNRLIDNRIDTLVIDVKVGNRLLKKLHILGVQFPVLLMRQLFYCTGTFTLLCKWELR